MTKYAYGLDWESFTGNYDTEADAIRDATTDAYDYWTGDGPFAIYIGEIKPSKEYLPSLHTWIGELITERVDEWLGEEIYYDNPIIELTQEQCTELGKVVADWLAENAKFNCDGVFNVREINV